MEFIFTEILKPTFRICCEQLNCVKLASNRLIIFSRKTIRAYVVDTKIVSISDMIKLSNIGKNTSISRFLSRKNMFSFSPLTYCNNLIKSTSISCIPL